MSTGNNQERLDTLLALALAFQDNDLEATERADEKDRSNRALRFLKDLGVDDAALTKRAEVYERLDRHKQDKWLKVALGRTHAHGRATRLDEQIHHSHLAQTLRAEPVRIQTLILKNLPKDLAQRLASELGIVFLVQEFINDQTPTDDLPLPEIASVIRDVFLSDFVTIDDLYLLKPLDLLSSVELVNFIHLVGARETAIACRGIAEVETVAAFLRRFTEKDARTIASYMSNLKNLEPARILFAEKLIQNAFSARLSHNVMLDQIGTSLAIIALVGSDRIRLRYTQQKLPFEARDEIKTMFDTACNVYASAEATERDMRNFIAHEIEYMASAFRKRSE